MCLGKPSKTADQRAAEERTGGEEGPSRDRRCQVRIVPMRVPNRYRFRCAEADRSAHQLQDAGLVRQVIDLAGTLDIAVVATGVVVTAPTT